MPDGFDNQRAQFQAAADLRFEMKQIDDEFWMQAINASGSTAGTAATTTAARMDLVLGSGGKFDDVFLSWRDDGTMVELPVVWLYPSQQWATSHFDPHAGGDYSRPLTVRCLECHNTWVNHVVGTANQYRRAGALLGVTCESCHGPAQDHVDFHRSHPQETLAKHIVHPGQLDRQRQIEVCSQCHSNSMQRRVPAFSYRPGTPLEDAFQQLVSHHHEDDHVANQTGFMQRSKCFQNSQSMTCVSCHDPHQPTSGRMTSEDTCLTCHQKGDCSDRENLPAAVQDACIECHMPPYIKINVNFQTEDDKFVAPIRRWQHDIAIYPQARKELLRDWHAEQADEAQGGTEHQQIAARLTDELIEYYLGQAAEAVAAHRLVGAIAACREALRVEPRAETEARLAELVAQQMELEGRRAEANRLLATGRRTEAIPVLEEILRRNPEDAIAQGRLGTALAELGKLDQAKQYWGKVVESNPNDIYGLAMLGWVAYNEKRFDEAREFYEQADAIEPYEAKIHYQLGMIEALTGNTAQALDYFMQALEIEPLHAGALEGVIIALRQQGKSQDAIAYALRAVELTQHGNPNVLMVLAETYAESNDLAHAKLAAEEAAKVARRVDPGLLPRIESRLASYQARDRDGL